MANVSGVRLKFADQVAKSLNNGVVPWQSKVELSRTVQSKNTQNQKQHPFMLLTAEPPPCR